MDANLKSRLLSSGILDKLKSSGDKYSSISDSKSLITVHEQQLYVWHEEGSDVLTVNLSASEHQPNDCNALLPSNPPVFDVECLLMNRLGNLLLLVGRKGIMVMEVPREISQLRAYSAGNNCLYCRSWTVADRIFSYTSRVVLLQAAWYPCCQTNTYVMILSSDNYIRLYDAYDLPTPLQAISLGPNTRSSFISTEFSISLPSCLGEMAVSFDFGPEEDLQTSTSSNSTLKNAKTDVTCPVYVLHGNGDVYVVRMNINKNGARSAKVLGPLAMYPPAEDNYGVDACTLLCLQSNPPVLVLAMASGMLYHCLVLDENSDDNIQTTWALTDSDNSPALYVHGSVQLPMFVTPEDDVYSQSIRLYRDVTTPSKYHCSMVCGIHTVVVPFVKKLEECTKSGDLEGIISELQENDCIVEHLLSTQPLTSGITVPVIGLASVIRSGGITLICLLASWEFACLPLLSSYRSYIPSLLSSEQDFSDKKQNDEQVESFESRIRSLLHRSTGTPIFKSDSSSDNNDKSTKQWLELVCSTTHRLREEYLQKFYNVHAQIDVRSKILVHHKQQQMLEVEQLMKSKDELKTGAKQLEEKYEKIQDRQQCLFQRIESILKALEQRYHYLSNAETNMKQELQGIEEKLKVFEVSLEQLKKKLKLFDQKAKDHQTSKNNENLNKQFSNMHIGETQLKHVKEILHQEGKSIAQLARDVSNLRKEVMMLS